MEKLRTAVNDKGVETEVFYLDPKVIQWEDYLMNIHIPGLVKYVFDWFYIDIVDIYNPLVLSLDTFGI